MPADARPADAHPADATPLPLIRLASLRRLMAHEGWDVDLARLCVDRGYALECLALAHTSGDERLRRTALTLFADWNDLPATVH